MLTSPTLSRPGPVLQLSAREDLGPRHGDDEHRRFAPFSGCARDALDITESGDWTLFVRSD